MSSYGPYMDKSGLGFIDPATATVVATGISTLAPSLLSILGVGKKDSVDPAGAQREALYQQKIAAQAQAEAAAKQAAQQNLLAAQKSSATSKLLIYGGLGLLVLGVTGILAYTVIKVRRVP